MSLATIEQEIITQLLPVRKELGIVVQCLPQSPSAWGSVAGKGWVSVQWDGSDPQGYSLGEISAEEWVDYSLDIRVKNLRGNGSLYEVIYRVRQLLWGFRPSVCYRPITVKKFNFLGMAEDYWVAQGGFTAYLYAGFSQQYSENFPEFVSGTFNYEEEF